MYMLAKITAHKEQFTLSVHPPGTGKSWIAALLIARYHLKVKGLKFLVLTSNTQLKEQLIEQLLNYFKNVTITFDVDSIPKTPEGYRKLVVIIDEFDSWLELHGIKTDATGFSGLYKLR